MVTERSMDKGLHRSFIAFIHEREQIRRKKEAGQPAPWTRDKILQTYRFCNIRRRDDRVSRWVIDRIITPQKRNPNLWLQLALARYINWPDTINALMEARLWPVSKEPRFADIGDFLDTRARAGIKTWTGAYMIRAESNESAGWYDWGKGRYVSVVVVGGVWERRAQIVPHLKTSVQAAHEALMEHGYGWGSFMAGQVVADLTYCEQYLYAAPDLYSYAPLGPGSRRGLNRLLKRGLTQTISQDDACALMRSLCIDIHNMLAYDLNLHDVQNCLCEFDKYQRVKTGEGRPRSIYRSHAC